MDVPFAEIEIDLELLTGEKVSFTWKQMPIKYIANVHNEAGVNYMEADGRVVCVPWHQIKKSSYYEKKIEYSLRED